MQINDIVDNENVTNKLHDSVNFYNSYREYISDVFNDIVDKAMSEFPTVYCDEGSIKIELPEYIEPSQVVSAYKAFIETKMSKVRTGYQFDTNPVFKFFIMDEHTVLIARKDY